LYLGAIKGGTIGICYNDEMAPCEICRLQPRHAKGILQMLSLPERKSVQLPDQNLVDDEAGGGRQNHHKSLWKFAWNKARRYLSSQ
jgi:hypothetical protein